MEFRFNKHYTREDARELLPQLREWIRTLQRLTGALAAVEDRISQLLRTGDVGGELSNRWLRDFIQIKELLREFGRREILIKDLERGLVDFPAFIGGKEVFLCWEVDEDDIEYWHDLSSGYQGREPLE